MEQFAEFRQSRAGVIFKLLSDVNDKLFMVTTELAEL